MKPSGERLSRCSITILLFSFHKSILILLLFTAGSALAGTREHFLSHGPSVPAYGRGETGAAAPEDAASAFYNPSLLAALQGSGLVLAEHPLFDGTAYSYAGFNTFPGKRGTALGFSVINLKSGDVEIRSKINDTPVTTRTNQWAYNLSCAATFTRFCRVDAGFNLKFIRYDMYKHAASGAGADIGLSREFKGPALFGSKSSIYSGLSVLNIIAPKIRLAAESEVLNPACRLGARLAFPVFYGTSSRDTASIDAEARLQEDRLNLAGGAQYSFRNRYILRAGYFSGHPTFGAGFRNSGWGLDYAVDLGAMEIINRFSLAFNWDLKKSRTAGSRNTLMVEAKKALRENEAVNHKLDKEADPIFKTALKDYRKKRYLVAADKFNEIALKYPHYGNADLYYGRISGQMKADAENTLDCDLEKVSYAKAYVSYRNRKYAEAVNEWEKVLQLNPRRSELASYIGKAREYLKDIERTRDEKLLEARVAGLIEEGKERFNERKWIACIKAMEKAQSICRHESFQSSYEMNTTAILYIDNSIKELAKTTVSKKYASAGDIQPAADKDPSGAERKYKEGLILYAQGKSSDAVRAWEIAVRLDPGNEKARKALARTKEELGINKSR